MTVMRVVCPGETMGHEDGTRQLDCDVSRIQPLAKEIVRQLAWAWRRHLGSHLVTLVAYGSAVKGGAIEGSSDVDVAAFVTPELLTSGGELPLDLTLALHHDLAKIDPLPFRYLQGHVYPDGVRAGSGFIPGTFQVVLGSPEVQLASGEELLKAAESALGTFDASAIRDRLSNALLDHGEQRLSRQVRILSTNDVWPTMYHIASIHEGDGVKAWQCTKPEIVSILGNDQFIGPPLAAWMKAITHHYSTGESVTSALNAIEAGCAFLDAVARWTDERLQRGA
jgi:hypothetical protein